MNGELRERGSRPRPKNKLGEPFRKKHALVIGINDYQNGLAPLQAAVNDATQIAHALQNEHGYETTLMLDGAVTRHALYEAITHGLKDVQEDDCLLFYFAGHGIAKEEENGLKGYLIPQDGDRLNTASFISMQEIHDSLSELPCRHLLVILDCCFAGAFRWSSVRDTIAPRKIYQEQYERYVRHPARQMIASASYDETALDSLPNGYELGGRPDNGEHSPFAEELLKGLRGGADLVEDGLITATELYVYLEAQVGQRVEFAGHRQTPRLWSLDDKAKGQFLFLVPGVVPTLKPAPKLDESANPYRALESYDEKHRDLFFGRDAVIQELLRGTKREDNAWRGILHEPLTIVTGASGTGKSSLVKAGVVPALKKQEMWREAEIDVVRPGTVPELAIQTVLQKVQTTLANDHSKRFILIIDQLEEVITQGKEGDVEKILGAIQDVVAQFTDRARVICTIRSDFEAHFTADSSPLKNEWIKRRYVVRPMTQDELRDVIERPAEQKVLFFEPPLLVDRLINDVLEMPGGLPLLSFTLSKLYDRYIESGRNNRALTQEDYDKLGGVSGALRQSADAEYDVLNDAHQATMKRTMLRMIGAEGSELARRRVRRGELIYFEPSETNRVETIINKLVGKRLLVISDVDGEKFVEPAHDALVTAWTRLIHWRNKASYLRDQRRIAQASYEWEQSTKKSEKRRLLWHNSPYLTQITNKDTDSTWLNKVETEFVEKSKERKQRNQRILWSAIITAFTIISIAAILAILNANRANDEADRANAEVILRTTEQYQTEAQRTDALVKSLLATSANLINRQPDVALLLGLEANQIASNELSSQNFWNTQVDSEFSIFNAIYANPRFNEILFISDTPLKSVQLSQSNKLLAIGDSEGTIRLWHIDRGEIIEVFRNEGEPVSDLVFTKDDEFLIASYGTSSSKVGEVIAWNLRTNDRLEIGDFNKAVTELAVSQDGTHVAAGGNDRKLLVWELVNGNFILRKEKSINDNIRSLSFHPNGRSLVVGKDGRGEFVALRLPDFEEIVTRQTNQLYVMTLDHSPNGKFLAVGGGNGSVYIYDTESYEFISETGRTYGAWVRSLKFTPDNSQIISAHHDSAVTISRVSNNGIASVEQDLFNHESSVNEVTWNSISNEFYTVGEDGKAIVWAGTVSDKSAFRHVYQTPLRDSAYSSYHEMLALGRDDGSVVFLDTSGKQIADPIDISPGHRVRKITFSPDGRWLVSGSDDGYLRFWEITKTSKLLELSLAMDPVPILNENGTPPTTHSLAFHPTKSDLFLSGTSDEARLWQITPNNEVRSTKLSCNDWIVSGIQFSPNGQLIAAGSWLSSVKIWNLQDVLNLNPIDCATSNEIPHQNLDTRTIGVSHDFDRAGVADVYFCDDETLSFSVGQFPIIWDFTADPEGENVTRFVGHNANVESLTCTDVKLSDQLSSIIISGDKRGRIMYWNADSKRLLTEQRTNLIHSVQINDLLFIPTQTRLISIDERGVIHAQIINPDEWLEIACETVNRSLTQSEWVRFFSDWKPYNSTHDPCATMEQKDDTDELTSTSSPEIATESISAEFELVSIVEQEVVFGNERDLDGVLALLSPEVVIVSRSGTPNDDSDDVYFRGIDGATQFYSNFFSLDWTSYTLRNINSSNTADCLCVTHEGVISDGTPFPDLVTYKFALNEQGELKIIEIEIATQ